MTDTLASTDPLLETEPAGEPVWTPPPRQPASGTKIFFVTLAAVVVGMLVFGFLLFLLMGALVAAAVASATDDGPAGSILEIDLRTPLLDHGVGPSVLGLEPASVLRVVRALDQAADDPDIEGVFLRAGQLGTAPASAEEIGDALARFEESGKFVLAFSQGFESPTLTAYAPVAEAEIWQQATTGFAPAGLRLESDYLGGVFEAVDADAEFVQFEQFKAAADRYDETGMTAPVREANTALLESVFDNLVETIAEARDLAPARVRELLDTAPHSAEAAREAGLIDELGHLEEARARARELAGDEDAEFLSLMAYALKRTPSGAPTIALITGQGGILPGRSLPGNTPFGGGPTIGSDTLAEAFDDAADNEDVRAILFRVSSPGGSAAASDQIHAAVARARAAGKPVVVSMGQYAASGGYYVSAGADHIVAQPATITGSIGVVAGKVALQGAFDKIDYNIEHVDVGGPYTGAFSVDTPFTDYQREAFTAQTENIYDDFLAVVAEGRDMELAEVRAVAGGRVWTGEQALQRGLVDSLGGFEAALTVAKDLAGIDADEEVRLRRYPRALTPEEQLQQLLSGLAQAQMQAESDLASLSALLARPEVRALLDAAPDAAMDATAGDLRARLPRIE